MFFFSFSSLFALHSLLLEVYELVKGKKSGRVQYKQQGGCFFWCWNVHIIFYTPLTWHGYHQQYIQSVTRKNTTFFSLLLQQKLLRMNFESFLWILFSQAPVAKHSLALYINFDVWTCYSSHHREALFFKSRYILSSVCYMSVPELNICIWVAFGF